jgi:hypothetical protein
MRENANTVLYMVRHNSLLLLGLGLVAMFLLLLTYIKFKLKNSGYGTAPFFFRARDWKLHADYRAVQSKRRWSPWPVHLIWPCLVAGVVSLLVGLLR